MKAIYRAFHMIPLSAQVWGFRILFFASIGLLCSWADSGFPALAFALAWGPNGLFLLAFMRGALRLPHVLEHVRPVEPVLYRWLGVAFVKQIVVSRLWPLVVGFEPPSKPQSRQDLLDRTDVFTKGAEVCHAATFLLALFVGLFCLVLGYFAEAMWIFAFNVLLNVYPIMLQRFNRWRIQQVRGSTRQQNLSSGRRAVY